MTLSLGFIVFFALIGGLFLGRAAYGLVLFFEGRRKINLYSCPSCGRGHFALFTVNWLFSAGKCLKCARRQDFRTLFIEIILGLCFAGVFWFLPPGWTAVEVCLFSFMAVIASAVDIKRTILPDTMTLGGLFLALAGAYFNPERTVASAFMGAVFSGGALALMSLMYVWMRKIEGMGMGDIKMIAWIGALTGWKGAAAALCLSGVLGVLFIGVSFLFKKKDSAKNIMKQELAFGPYLAFSAYVCILLQSSDFINYYFNL